MSALPDFAFRRVLLKGRFRGPPILQGPQTRDGVAGYHLIVPFDRSAEGGSTVLVNQGFILTAEGDAIREGRKPVPGLAADGGPGEDTVIEAMLTKIDHDAKSYFVPENDPHDNRWFWKDIPDMAEWVGGEARGVQPVLVDVIDRELHCSQFADGQTETAACPLPCASQRACRLDGRRRSSCATST